MLVIIQDSLTLVMMIKILICIIIKKPQVLNVGLMEEDNGIDIKYVYLFEEIS